MRLNACGVLNTNFYCLTIRLVRINSGTLCNSQTSELFNVHLYDIERQTELYTSLRYSPKLKALMAAVMSNFYRHRDFIAELSNNSNSLTATYEIKTCGQSVKSPRYSLSHERPRKKACGLFP